MASRSVASVALLTWPASWLTIACKCGLLWVAGHCRAPMVPLSTVLCLSVTGWVSGPSSKLIGFSLEKYLLWCNSLWCSLILWIVAPQYSMSVSCSHVRKLKVFFRELRKDWKFLLCMLPHPRMSSTCRPNRPSCHCRRPVLCRCFRVHHSCRP